MEKKRVLICPLDWGLGHATRMIPLTEFLISKDIDVQLAAGEKTLRVLKEEFPGIKTHILPTLSPEYSKNRKLLVFKLFAQIPGLFFKSSKEHQVVKKIILKESIQAVISDNRLGLWNLPVKSAYITHQIQFRLKGLLRFMNPILAWGHRLLIRKHDICFVPDSPAIMLSGALGDLQKLNIQGHFIGTLSRLTFNSEKSPGNNILILLSGQEPQRTILEQKLLQQIAGLNHTFVLVKGTPENTIGSIANSNLQIVNYANKQQLSQLMQEAKLVICRSGYSTVMDLVTLQKQAILIPTPGQAEQEYLGKYYHKKCWFYCQEQDKLDIKKALDEGLNFHPPKIKNDEKNLIPVLNWINGEA